MSTPYSPTLLLIFDGWGHRSQIEGNAILQAHTPNFDNLLQECPHTLLSGCGQDVGLPPGQMGNSEVGHLTLGAGRTIYQDLSRITHAIETGTFFENPSLKAAFAQAKSTQRAVHIMGLLSPGGVHSHEDHLFACLTMAAKETQTAIYLHAFLDGRDTAPKSALASLEKLKVHLRSCSNASLASVCGRYYAMDRDQRWERVKQAFDAIAFGKAPFYAASGEEALMQAYARGETDEFVKPTCIVTPHSAPCSLQEGDILIYMNFRADRARALTQAFNASDFTGFARSTLPMLGQFVCLTQYDKKQLLPVAFAPQIHTNVLSEYLAHLHFTQLHLAETEKYAHVTFFFNGGKEAPFPGEERILIPSPSVATYDLQPQMSAQALTEALVTHIEKKQFNFIVCNYANADMVGHTGNFTATLKAIETLDVALGEIVRAIEKVNGQMLLTADHGNAECMIDPHTHDIHTAHTTSLVPLIYKGSRKITFKPTVGTLSDVAPTMLTLMELPVPKEMTGTSLIEKIT